MGKGKKVSKKVVGSANGRAARGGEVDGSTAEFAVAGMQLQEPTAAAAEGSGGESMVPGDAGPPALSTLDDVAPRPAVSPFIFVYIQLMSRYYYWFSPVSLE